MGSSLRPIDALFVFAIPAATLVLGDLGSTVWYNFFFPYLLVFRNSFSRRSSVITAHTFSTLALRKQWSRETIMSIVVAGWSFVIFISKFGCWFLRHGTHLIFVFKEPYLVHWHWLIRRKARFVSVKLSLTLRK
jgi:hypothetical protein